MESYKTIIWWRILSTIGLLNIAIWGVCYVHITSQEFVSPYHYPHLYLSGIYTVVCAFRSIWPRIDLERYVLIDHWVSSIVLGRSAATIAEISFALQMKIFLDELCALSGDSQFAQYTFVIVISLSLAQVFCWLGVITLNHLGHAIEESIWGLTFIIISIGIARSISTLEGTWLIIAWISLMATTIYVIFMCVIDIPMYLKKWTIDRHKQNRTLHFKSGFKDALTSRKATRAWSTWKPEVAWLTGYFSCAVWLSLSLNFLPH